MLIVLKKPSFSFHWIDMEALSLNYQLTWTRSVHLGQLNYDRVISFDDLNSMRKAVQLLYWNLTVGKLGQINPDVICSQPILRLTHNYSLQGSWARISLCFWSWIAKQTMRTFHALELSYCSWTPWNVFQLVSLWWIKNFQNLSDLQQQTCYMLAAAGQLSWLCSVFSFQDSD